MGFFDIPTVKRNPNGWLALVLTFFLGGLGTIIIGLTDADVASAIQAHEGGQSLADAAGYPALWDLAGDRGGNELFVDIGSIVPGDQRAGADRPGA